jgi:hypothetical protein
MPMQPSAIEEVVTMKRITALILFAFLLVNGCSIPSLNQTIRESMGQPISHKIEIMSRPNSYSTSIDWKEKTYKLDNGNWVYVQPDRPGCFIHWEVNPEGIIVGYKLEGRCS